MLTPTQELLWQEYLKHEEVRIRNVSLDALERFILSVETEPIQEWCDWAYNLCGRVVDDGENIPIRFPLFRRVLFPSLFLGYQGRLPGCARWLDGFHQLLYKSPECRNLLGNEYANRYSLLKTALEHDPHDADSLNKLIQVFVRDFDYALHEIPAGVLYSMNGATIDQCRELEEALAEFCELASAANQEECHAELIEACRAHFAGYRDYLQRRVEYQSYEDYIRRHNLVLW